MENHVPSPWLSSSFYKSNNYMKKRKIYYKCACRYEETYPYTWKWKCFLFDVDMIRVRNQPICSFFTSQIVCIYENMIWIEFIMHYMKLWVDNDYSIWYTTTEIHVLNFKYSSCCCLYVVFAFRLIRVWIRVLTYSMSLDDRNQYQTTHVEYNMCE